MMHLTRFSQTLSLFIILGEATGCITEETNCVSNCVPDAPVPDPKVIFRVISQTSFAGWQQAAAYKKTSGAHGFVVSDGLAMRLLQYDPAQSTLASMPFAPMYRQMNNDVTLSKLWAVGTLTLATSSRLVVAGEGRVGTPPMTKFYQGILQCSLDDCVAMNELNTVANSNASTYVANSLAVFGNYDTATVGSRIYVTLGYDETTATSHPVLSTLCQQINAMGGLDNCAGWNATTRTIAPVQKVDRVVVGSLNADPSPDTVVHANENGMWKLLTLNGESALPMPDTSLPLANTTSLLGLSDLDQDGKSDAVLFDSVKNEIQVALYSPNLGSFMPLASGTALTLPAGEVVYQVKLSAMLENNGTQQLLVLSGPMNGSQAHLQFFDLALQDAGAARTPVLKARDAVQLVDEKMIPLTSSTVKVASSKPAPDDVLVGPLDDDAWPDLVVRSANGLTVLLRVRN